MFFCKYSDVEHLIYQKDKLFSYIKDPKTFICYLFPYYVGEFDSNISKYARGKDYHLVVKDKLEQEIANLKTKYPNGNFCVFCDNSPLPEVQIAYLSGAGILGKNGLIFDEKYGGYVFIGIIATDILLDFEKTDVKNCISCNLCIKSCPTGALTLDGVLEQKCLSYLTQTNRELEDFEQKFIEKSKYIWGCDICLDVCPMNKNALQTDVLEYRENLVDFIEISDDLTRKQFNQIYPNRAFTFRGPKPILRNLWIKSNNMERR